uniref:Uncharacterized protein n=1 Tax=Schizaphis graminum TaxID=13262 RepID=A0A2S2PDA0_SCHGA
MVYTQRPCPRACVRTSNPYAHVIPLRSYSALTPPRHAHPRRRTRAIGVPRPRVYTHRVRRRAYVRVCVCTCVRVCVRLFTNVYMTLRACTGSLTTVKRPPRGTVPVISGPFHWPRAPVALAGKRRRCTATGREPHSSFSGLSIRTYSSAVVVLLSFTVSLQLQYIAPSAIT